MIEGGENLSMLFDRGLDYIHNSFNTSEGVVNRQQPTLLYRGIVIEIDFTTIKPTTTAALMPPFSIYAKVIGLDADSEDPISDYDRVYYPPLFPMHSLCIPEVGEEILIMKESPEATSKGYYIGRVNDSTPLNISYARDFVGLNDPQTENNARYGFSFDVRELRKQAVLENPTSMPSAEYNNVSIPITYGDVVQQGRSKTYLRHSFNKNNKKGVLEQGIQLDGQSTGQAGLFDYSFNTAGVNNNSGVVKTNTVKDEDGNPYIQAMAQSENYFLSPDEVMRKSYDPSIGETGTKTIHFIDSSIKRLGNYVLQSDVGGAAQNDITGRDKSMIVNKADEIYNISSRELSGNLYRQVLGEKLVSQQQESYNLMKEILVIVQGLATSTNILLHAFLDHEHALPVIDLNLQKTFQFDDWVRTAPTYSEETEEIITLPGVPSLPVFASTNKSQYTDAVNAAIAQSDINLVPDINSDGLHNFDDYFAYNTMAEEFTVGQTIAYQPETITITHPPTIVKPGEWINGKTSKTLDFQAIIGGEEDPRFTAQIATASGIDGVPDPAIGVQTQKVLTNLNKTVSQVAHQQAAILQLSNKITNFLSKNQFIN